LNSSAKIKHATQEATVNRIRVAIVWVLFCTVLLCAACDANPVSLPSEESAETGSPIQISDVWSRSTPNLMGGSGIVYMVLSNSSNQPDRLVASKSPVAKFSELHETSIEEDGVMRMRGVKGGFIEIPAGGSVALEPAGLHVMLIELEQPLQAGDVFPLTLKFERAGELTIDVPVLDTPPEG
jgi:copper(I)-binding protein